MRFTSLTLLATLGTLGAFSGAGCTGVDSGALDFDAGSGADSGSMPPRDAGNLPRMDGASGMCSGGLLLCGAACIDPSADPANCGGCGHECGAGSTCVSGTCSGCTPGTSGCTTSPIGNPDACGPSRTTCAVTQACVGGACQCLPGLTRVGDACVDLLSDPNNCGAPGMRCTSGVCSGGHCATTCASARVACEGACVDLHSDVRNCGECGHRCDRGQLCIAGACRGYRSAGDCLSCPCTTCTGDLSQCCPFPGTATAVCVGGDTC